VRQRQTGITIIQCPDLSEPVSQQQLECWLFAFGRSDNSGNSRHSNGPTATHRSWVMLATHVKSPHSRV